MKTKLNRSVQPIYTAVVHYILESDKRRQKRGQERKQTLCQNDDFEGVYVLSPPAQERARLFK